MRKHQHHEVEHDDFEETRNTTLLTRSYNLLDWVDNLEIGSPNLLIPPQIANYVGSCPFCRFAITPRLDRIAIINFNRELNVYILDGDNVIQESRVQVLEEEFPEYCLLQYSDCGNLLLSTRSSAEIDVFDHSGGYCYGIQLETTNLNLDLRSAICCMQTIKNSISCDDKYLDWLYVMQYNGTFSAFKIGRLSRYCQMWSCQLNIGLVNSFIILKGYNLLLVGAHYPIQGNTKPPGGLCSFRLIDEEPFIDPIRTLEHNTGWQSYLPFSSSQYSFISSMSLSLSSPHKLACISTNGDLFIYNLPSTAINTVIKQFGSLKPIQAVFVDENEIAVTFNDGTLIRSEIDDIEKSVMENLTCEKYDGRAEMLSPKARELFILVEKKGSGVHREIVSERTFLAARIWMYTIWSTLKSLIGMAVGDAPAPLQMMKHSDSYSFALHYLPTRTLQQLLDRTLNDKDYEGAKQLAASYDSININTILKREWMDVNGSDSVSIDAVQDILNNITDKKWVAEACINCSSSNLDAQRAIAKLGMSLSSITVEKRIHLLHNARILSACPNISFYLTHRSKSLLSAAQELAKLGDVASLQRLMEKNYELLKPYLLSILTSLPPALPPVKYRLFLPLSDNSSPQIKEERDSYMYEVESSLLQENPSLMYCVNFEGAEEIAEPDSYPEWVRRRSIDIEEDTGLYNNSLQLLTISMGNGFNELDEDITRWKIFVSYVKMCTAVNESFSGFWNRSIDVIISNVSKLDAEQLLTKAEEIIGLIEFRVKDHGIVREHIQSLLVNTCERTTKVLKKFKELRPTIVDKDMITRCMCYSPFTGKTLLDELRALSVYPEVCSAIRALLDLHVTPTFQRLLESKTDVVIARSVLTQAIANMSVETSAEWETLKDDVLHLADSIYSKLVPRIEVVQLLAKELLLNDILRRESSLLGTLLTLDKNGPKEFDGNKLGQIKSAEVLMTLSLEVMNNAVQKNDVNLDKSRFFATLARPISPKIAHEQLKFLDAIDIMHELGSTIMPATVRLYDPMQILQEMVDFKNNYKKGKTLAKLATLLDVPTPVSTALSLASLVAIQRKDEECLTKYIAEIMKARDIPIVHKLCMQILKSSYVLSALEDVYACALLNCPNDELTETLNIIDENRRSKRGLISTLPDLSQDIIIDPSCSKVEAYVRRNPLSENCRLAITNLSSNVKPTMAARIWARESASAALSFAIMNSDNGEHTWTENETLQRYEQALRHFMVKMSPRLIENIPPKLLIERYNKIQGNDTPLDRIEMQGVNRERFITDAIYREDSLDGLSMTEDDGVFADAVALANQFHVNEWQLHMTSLENALTTCTPSETKRILKARGHLSKLRANLERFHSSLRSNVFPLLDTSEMFIAYLSLFSDDQPEKAASPILKKILERKKELKAKRLFTDPEYLNAVIISMPDKFIISFADGLRKYQVGVEACEKAARILLDGTEIRPPASVLVIFSLLGEDESTIVDLIASKSLEEEILYLENAIVILEATPNSPEKLSKLLHERLDLLKTPVELSSSPEPVEPAFILTSRRRQ